MIKNKNTIFIGDNLCVMKNSSCNIFYNKIKMIYIDPPYNTKTRKSYEDNKEDNNWIEFMYLRLLEAKKYLREDGVIFISIDDNEFAELKIICDKIFGKNNFVGNFITYQSLRSNAKLINVVHEYILCYAKNKSKVKEFKIKRIDIPKDKIIIDELYEKINFIIKKQGLEEARKQIGKIIKDICEKNDITWLKNYSNIDDEGKIYFAMDLSTPGEPKEVNIEKIGMHLEPLLTRGWSSDEKFIDLYNNNLLVYKEGRPYEKHYLYDACDNVTSILRFFSRNGTNDLKKMGIQKLFDTPKPVELVKFLLKISCEKNDIVMDFFAGCGTTAQAVYELNNEWKYNLTYVIIQIKEKINEKTNTYKECKKIGLEPFTSSIMQYRIDKYLSLENKDKDYIIYEVES